MATSSILAKLALWHVFLKQISQQRPEVSPQTAQCGPLPPLFVFHICSEEPVSGRDTLSLSERNATSIQLRLNGTININRQNCLLLSHTTVYFFPWMQLEASENTWLYFYRIQKRALCLKLTTLKHNIMVTPPF